MLQAYCVETADLYLVPYEVGHVPKYHRWMQTKELQVLTASESLSLEEVFWDVHLLIFGVLGEVSFFMHSSINSDRLVGC